MTCDNQEMSEVSADEETRLLNAVKEAQAKYKAALRAAEPFHQERLRAIAEAAAAGVPRAEIARNLGVTREHMYRLLRESAAP